jgi:hypothetical protein
VAVHATNNMVNIKSSIDKYILDNLETTEGLTVNYEGLPFESGATLITQWVQPRLMDSIDPTWKPKATATTRGNLANVLLNINCFVKKDWTEDADAHYTLRDTVANYFYSGVSIPLRDYVGGTTRPWTTLMVVANVATDTPIQGPELDYLQYNYSVEIEWIRQWAD